MRVRLVFETEIPNVKTPEFAAELAADEWALRLNDDNSIEGVHDIFKEVRTLRPFTRKEGVVYGRPKKNSA